MVNIALSMFFRRRLSRYGNDVDLAYDDTVENFLEGLNKDGFMTVDEYRRFQEEKVKYSMCGLMRQ